MPYYKQIPIIGSFAINLPFAIPKILNCIAGFLYSLTAKKILERNQINGKYIETLVNLYSGLIMGVVVFMMTCSVLVCFLTWITISLFYPFGLWLIQEHDKKISLNFSVCVGISLIFIFVMLM
jgi:hypothetical protein